jgi:hypothetical protein
MESLLVVCQYEMREAPQLCGGFPGGLMSAARVAGLRGRLPAKPPGERFPVPFWTWASVEFFGSTGCRIEEMMEVSHHSVTQYAVPHSGEVIPLLQIAPSKTDTDFTSRF